MSGKRLLPAFIHRRLISWYGRSGAAAKPTAALTLFALVLVTGWYAPSLAGGTRPRTTHVIEGALANDGAFYRGKATRRLPDVVPGARLLFRADLRQGLPRTWHLNGDARVAPADHGILASLRTGSITTVAVRLPRGEYEVLVNANVVRGGIQAGLVSSADAACRANAFLARSGYPQPSAPLGFSVRERGLFYLTLYNWSPNNQRSSAIIRAISLYEVSPLIREAAIAHYYEGTATRSLRASSINRDVQSKWQFDHGVPEDWALARGAHARTSLKGLLIRTGKRNDYALESPLVLFDPLVKRYAISLKGRVMRGGLRIGVLDVVRNVFIKQGLFWAGQRRTATSEYLFAFEAPNRQTKFRIILGNWSPVDRASSWLIQDVSLALAY